jgi:urea ABC transporter ATP-binding protein UrtE
MLSLENVQASYGRTPVLQGVTLEIEAGEVVAILGRNGVGKTTTLRAIMGHIPLRGGAVLFEGEDLRRIPPHARARRGITYVPQGRDIFPRLSVLENLRVAAHGSRRARWREELDAILDEFPILGARRHQRGGSLSGGQQQILALARALVTEPRLVLLDEPTEGIQPTIVAEIADIVRELSERRGLTVLLVEQNLDFATRLARRAYLMDKGTVVRELSAQDILEDRDLQHEYMGV